MRAALKWTGLGCSLVVAAALGFALFSKQLAEFGLSQALGREVEIKGEFDIALGKTLTIHAENILIANAKWSEIPHMLEVGALTASIELPALIDGRVVLPKLKLVKPQVLVQVSDQGKLNWSLFEDQPEEPQQPPRQSVPIVRHLTIDDGGIRYLDRADDTEITAILNSFEETSGPKRGLVAQGSGRIEGKPLQLSLTAGSLKSLSESDEPWPIELQVQAGATRAVVEGTLTRPLQLQGMDLQLLLASEDPGELFPLIGIPVPKVGSYRIAGELSKSGETWSLTDFEGHFGDSNLHGSVAADFRGPRPSIQAELASSKLDFDTLAALFNAVPNEGEAVGVPKDPIDVEKLRAVNAQVSFKAAEVVGTELPIDRAAFELTLKDGLLRVEPLVLGIGAGEIKTTIVLDASHEPVSGRIELALDRVPVKPVLAALELQPAAEGIIGGKLALAFTGDDIGLADGRLMYRNLDRNTHLVLTLERVTREQETLLKAHVEGTFRSSSAELTFIGQPLTVLTEADSRYPVKLEVRLADTEAKIEGTLVNLGEQFTLDFSASGPGTQPLSKLTGYELPPIPKYHISGHLVRGDHFVKVESLSAQVGQSDLAGTVAVRTQDREPFIEADLKSSTLTYSDFDQLRGKKEKEPFDLQAALDKFNADIEFTANRVLAPEDLALRNVRVDALLKKGRITLEPLRFEVAGGRVALNLQVAPAKDLLTGSVHANIKNVDLGDALKPMGLADTYSGVLDADVDLVLGPRASGSARLHYREPENATDLTLKLMQKANETMVDGDGEFRGEPFQLQASLGPLGQLASPGPYPVNIHIEAVDTEARIRGTLEKPLQLKGLELTLAIAGPNPERLDPLLAIHLPNLPPYQVEGELSRHGTTWTFKDFTGVVGDSDLSGTVSVNTAGPKPFVRANLLSHRLDFDDLSGLIGAPPGVGPGETASPKQIEEKTRAESRERALPDKPFRFDLLRQFNAVVHYRAEIIDAPSLPLSHMRLEFTLKDGELELEPLILGVAEGEARMHLVLNGSAVPPEGEAEIELNRVHLGKLLNQFALAQDTAGVIGGRVKLWFTGDTLARMLASADGGAFLIMSGGRLDALLVELVGLDAGESLVTWLVKGGQTIPIRCAYADLQLRNGIVKIARFAVDSRDTKFTADGTIDLREETVDVVIQPHPKDISILAARSPLLIQGSFKDLTVYPAPGRLIARGAAAIALAAIAPPAALLALIEPGLGTGAQCEVFSGVFEEEQPLESAAAETAVESR